MYGGRHNHDNSKNEGARGSVVVEALCYKRECRWIMSR
jgi:hypothetical protein